MSHPSNDSKPRIMMVGPYEMYQAFDQVFLLITERYVRGASVTTTAPFEADMTAQLDRHVHPYGQLLNAEQFDAIWTVGVSRVRAEFA